MKLTLKIIKKQNDDALSIGCKVEDHIKYYKYRKNMKIYLLLGIILYFIAGYLVGVGL